MYLTANVDYRVQNISLGQYLPTLFLQFSTNIFHDKSFGALFLILCRHKNFFSVQPMTSTFISTLYSTSFYVVFYGQYYRPQRPNNRVLLQLDCLDKILNYSLKIILNTQYTLHNRRFLQVGQGQGQIICLQYRQLYNELYQRPWINILQTFEIQPKTFNSFFINVKYMIRFILVSQYLFL